MSPLGRLSIWPLLERYEPTSIGHWRVRNAEPKKAGPPYRELDGPKHAWVSALDKTNERSSGSCG